METMEVMAPNPSPSLEADEPKKAKAKIGRPGITQDQVFQAAYRLVTAGKRVTIDAVREELGHTGGKGTIHQALKVWPGRNQPVAAPPELPTGLIREIAREMEKAVTEARAEVQERLVEAQEGADKLAEALTAAEAERDAFQDEIAALTSQRDQALALATERMHEIQRLGEALGREQAAVKSAHVDLAKAQLRVEAEAEKVQASTEEMARLRADIEAQAAGRQQVEKDLVEARTQLVAEQASKAEALARERAAQEREREALAKVDAVRAEAREVTDRLVAEANVAADKRVAEIKTVTEREVAAIKAAVEREIAAVQAVADRDAERVLVLERAGHEERAKAASAEARCLALADQVTDLKSRLDRAEASLEKARETYQSMVLAAKEATPSKQPSPGVAEGEELLKPSSPPAPRKRAGAQLQDRQV